jgi:abortive infection bacteriophage resistance protein
VPYTKSYLSVSDQLSLLKSRGLQVVDDHHALSCLRRNGYYRLTGYLYPFREFVSGVDTNRFLASSYFEDAIQLYNFDKRFKLLLLDALECIEIACRVEIALTLGQLDKFAQDNRQLFHTRFTTPTGSSDYDKWIKDHNDHINRSKDKFMAHHRAKYGRRAKVPIWIAIELWDFGLLSRCFAGLKVYDQTNIAARFGIPSPVLMVSWLRSLNYVRNIIAHHGRLWNIRLVVSPALPAKGQSTEFDDLLPLPNVAKDVYSICCILSYLTHIINPGSPWIDDFKRLVHEFPIMPYASIQNMGFPQDWETHGFWTYNPPC